MFLIVNGKPVAQPRPKFVAKPFPRAYTPTKHPVNAWREQLTRTMQELLVLGEEPLYPKGEALIVTLAFSMPRPASHLTSIGTPKTSVTAQHTQKPDLDNLAKPVLDVMVEMGIMHDDSQVVSLNVRKQWTIDNPGVVIVVDLYEQKVVCGG